MQRLRHAALRAALSQLRCSSSILIDGAAASGGFGADAARLAAAQLRAAVPLASAAAGWQHPRGFTAATVLTERRKGGGQRKAEGAGAAAQPPPVPPPAAAGSGSVAAGEQNVEGDLEFEEGEDDADSMGEAFERLIQAAYEMVQQGKPMEAEYVLSEGAKQAEEILGSDALELAALYDQLCIIRFLHDRMNEAAEAAKRALDILKQHDQGFGPATAIASTRYAATLVATGNAQEAQLYAGRSIDSLEKALKMVAEFEAEDAEEEEELADTKTKFEMGLGESKFYHGLACQAQTQVPADVGQFLPEMQAGLEAMQEHLGADSPLIAAALREHSRLIMAALESDQQELAEALYGQDARLHMAAGGNFEHVALTLYQRGTLQYVMSKYEAAAESLQMSLQTVRQHYPEAEEHMLTVQQRLGMVLALLGQHEEAKAMLHDVAPALLGNLGEGNPASEELDFMLAMIGLREMAADGVADPVRRKEWVANMEKHLAALSGYGEEHMLVKKAKELYEAEVAVAKS